jgi:hypothetical protein
MTITKIFFGLTLVLVVVFGAWIGKEAPPCKAAQFPRGITKPILATEIASNQGELENAVTECNKDRTPESKDARDQFVAATKADYFLIGAYGLALVAATGLLFLASKQKFSRRLLYLSFFCAVAAPIADVFEDRGVIDGLLLKTAYSPTASLIKWALLFAIFLFWALAVLIEPVFGKIVSLLFAFAAIPTAFVGLVGVKDSSGVIETGSTMLLVPLFLVLFGLFRLKPPATN